MIVCVCKSISDRRLSALLRDGVASVEALQFETGCGTNCGRCLNYVEQMVAQQTASCGGRPATLDTAQRAL